MRKPGGSLTRLRFALIASAFAPDCGTGGMLRSVLEAFICFNFSILVTWAVTGMADTSSATQAAAARMRRFFMLWTPPAGGKPGMQMLRHPEACAVAFT